MPRIEAEHGDLVRRAIIDRIGPERFIAISRAEAVSKDETGTLWRKRILGGDIWSVVQVVNGTPEPDGSYKRYYLRVPPEMQSAREAVAWTYGMRESEYQPRMRT
jgi:hypothetical protein